MNVAEVKRSGKQLQITAQISVFTCKAASSTCKPLHLPVIFLVVNSWVIYCQWTCFQLSNRRSRLEKDVMMSVLTILC